MKIALIGSAPSSVALAPYRDKSYDEFLAGKPAPLYPPSPYIADDWEIWGCSPGAYGQVQRATRWFEVHRWEPGQTWFSPEYVGFLKDFRGPVYTGAPIQEIKNHVVYPIDRVQQEFSPYFLTSSLSLMCALAILEIEDKRKLRRFNLREQITSEMTAAGKIDQESVITELERRAALEEKEDIIGFFGVDMAATEEYGYQRAGCQHFILEAIRRGIGIYVPPESDLLRPMPVYGLCEWDHNYIKLTARSREMSGRMNAARERLASAQQEATFLQGALDDLGYMANTWTSQYGLPAGRVIRRGP